MRFIGACLIAVGLWMFLSSVLAAPWDMKLVGRLFFGGMVYVGLLIYRIPAKKQQKFEAAIANLPEVKGADYKHIFNTSAIALSKGNQTLFLADGHARKTYSFADVRKWSYEVLSGGGVVGGGGLQQGGCKNFCVNGQLAGNCRAPRSEYDRSKESSTQGVDSQPAG